MKILLILIGVGVISLIIYFLINYSEYKYMTPKIGSKLTFNQFKAFYYVKPKAWSLDYFIVAYRVQKKVPYGTNDFYYTTGDYKIIYFTSFWEWLKYNRWKKKKEEHDRWNETFKEMTDLVGFWQEDINKNQQKVLDELKEKINETKKF